MNTGFDFNILDSELTYINEIDMQDFGFEINEIKDEDFDTEFKLTDEEKSDIEQITFTFHKNQAEYIKSALELFSRKSFENFENKNEKYIFDSEKAKQIEKILKILIMPRGLKAGSTIYDCSCGYQWFFYFSVLCVVHKENKDKRKYETAILEIARKNFKTFTIATVFVLLFLLEPKFSKFYSVAPDGALSREVKTAIEEILKSSPKIDLKKHPRFKVLRDYIQFDANESRYIPLNYSNSRMDGKLPNVFLADEVGALPNSYCLEAMRSG